MGLLEMDLIPEVEDMQQVTLHMAEEAQLFCLLATAFLVIKEASEEMALKQMANWEVLADLVEEFMPAQRNIFWEEEEVGGLMAQAAVVVEVQLF